MPETALEEHSGGVDRNALRLFVFERVEQEGVLEGLRVQLTLGPYLLEFSFRKGTRIGKESADNRALAVIDVADDHDAHTRLRF